MRFQVLGCIEVEVGGESRSLGGQRQQAVLAALLLHANQPVTRSRLESLVWGDPPDSARANLRTYLMRLRALLCESPEAASRLHSTGDRVCLRVEPGELDVAEFERLTRRGDEAAAAGKPAEAATAFDEALSRWSGGVLEGAAVDSPLRALVCQLEERRGLVATRRWECLLDAGQFGQAVSELREAVVAEPLREDVVALLMRALYRDGHGDEAVAVYRDTRNRFADALGVEPGGELTVLRERIQAGDPALEQSIRTGRPMADIAEARSLPAGTEVFVGRGDHLDRIATVARSEATVKVVAIHGMAGVGKTAVAVRAATNLAEEFPDGQLFIDLQGYATNLTPLSADVALERLLSGIGISKTEMPWGLRQSGIVAHVHQWSAACRRVRQRGGRRPRSSTTARR